MSPLHPSPVKALLCPSPAGELTEASQNIFMEVLAATPGLWHGTATFTSSAEPGCCPAWSYFHGQVFSPSAKAFGEANYLGTVEIFGLPFPSLCCSLAWLGSLIFCKTLEFYFRVEISYEIQMYFMIPFCCQLFYF